MSSETDYIKLVVSSVELQSDAYESNYAVPKSYVDDVKSSIMGGLTTQALDTIKELAEYMADSTVAGGLVSQISTLTTSIEDEAKRATAAEADLDSRISGVETAGEQAVADEQSRALLAESALEIKIQSESDRASLAEGQLDTRATILSSALEEEKTRATSAETDLDSRISSVETAAETAVASERSRAEAAEALKADLSGATFTGDIQLADSYLQFGLNWRVKASGDGRRLVFEYKRDQVWKTAIPFITSL